MDGARARRLLEARRVELAGIAAGLDLADEDERSSQGELSTVDQHPADEGTELATREADLGLAEQVGGELEDIELALHRLEDGTYGTCEVCGTEIPDERLEALPAARRCLRHQRDAEAEAAAGIPLVRRDEPEVPR